MSITLKSSDNEIVIVDKAVALQLLTVKAIIEDCGANDEIPVPRVTREILEHVILYCTKHLELEGNNLWNWEVGFARNLDLSTLYQVLMAADYLNVPTLQRLLCCRVAMMCKGRRMEEVGRILNVQNDFTEEEVGKFRRENDWAFK